MAGLGEESRRNCWAARAGGHACPGAQVSEDKRISKEFLHSFYQSDAAPPECALRGQPEFSGEVDTINPAVKASLSLTPSRGGKKEDRNRAKRRG